MEVDIGSTRLRVRLILGVINSNWLKFSHGRHSLVITLLNIMVLVVVMPTLPMMNMMRTLGRVLFVGVVMVRLVSWLA